MTPADSFFELQALRRRSGCVTPQERGPRAMMPRLLPVFLSMTLLGPLLSALSAGAHDLPVAAGDGAQSPKESIPVARSNDGRDNDGKVQVTRSDGSTGRTSPPDQKEVKKLVGYMLDGIKRADRADRAERQSQTRKGINRRIWIKK
jgi:hypothetical protein